MNIRSRCRFGAPGYFSIDDMRHDPTRLGIVNIVLIYIGAKFFARASACGCAPSILPFFQSRYRRVAADFCRFAVASVHEEGFFSLKMTRFHGKLYITSVRYAKLRRPIAKR